MGDCCSVEKYIGDIIAFEEHLHGVDVQKIIDWKERKYADKYVPLDRELFVRRKNEKKTIVLKFTHKDRPNPPYHIGKIYKVGLEIYSLATRIQGYTPAEVEELYEMKWERETVLTQLENGVKLEEIRRNCFYVGVKPESFVKSQIIEKFTKNHESEVTQMKIDLQLEGIDLTIGETDTLTFKEEDMPAGTLLGSDLGISITNPFSSLAPSALSLINETHDAYDTHGVPTTQTVNRDTYKPPASEGEQHSTPLLSGENHNGQQQTQTLVMADEIIKLARLKDAGHLNEKEFLAAKSRLIFSN